MTAAARKRWLGWATLMLLTGLMTAWLRGQLDPLIPTGDWHALLSALTVMALWPSLAWSLRALGRWLRANTLDAAYVVALLWL